MRAFLHEKKNIAELQEVHVFLRLQRMLHEERNDAFEQMLLPANAVRHAIRMIHANYAASEMRLQRMEDLNVAFVLDHSEFWKNLEAGGHFDVRIDADMKASFSVDKSDDPLSFEFHEMSPKHEVSEDFRFDSGEELSRTFPADCPHVRQIFTAAFAARTGRLWRSFPHMVWFY